MAQAYFSEYLENLAKDCGAYSLSYDYSSISQIVRKSDFVSTDLVRTFKERVLKEVTAYLKINGKQVTKNALLNNKPYQTTIINGTWYINRFGLSPVFKTVQEAVTDNYMEYLYLDAIADVYEYKISPKYQSSSYSYNKSTEKQILAFNRLRHLFCDSELVSEMKKVNNSKNIISAYSNDGLYNRKDALKTAQALSLNLLLNSFHDDKYHQFAKKIISVVDYYFAFDDLIGDENGDSMFAEARHKRIEILLKNFKYQQVFKMSSHACFPEKSVEEVVAVTDNSASFDAHANVDLGLSVYWAKYNIGKSESTDGTLYTYSTENDVAAKEWGIDKDVAAKEWGDSWRIPYVKEIKELIENCTKEYIDRNGDKTNKDNADKIRLTSKINGATIDFPIFAHKGIIDAYYLTFDPKSDPETFAFDFIEEDYSFETDIEVMIRLAKYKSE